MRLLPLREWQELSLKYRIGMWAVAGFLVAGCWALYALAATPLNSADPIMTFVRLTCPIALFSSYPLSLYLVLIANAATYGLVGLLLEIVRQREHPAR
jgi:hypothetical protein